MKKHYPTLAASLLAVLFIVGACGPTPTPEPTPTEKPAPTATPAPSTPITGPAGSESEVDDGEFAYVTPEEVGYCEPAPLPSLPVRPFDETDWAKGASEDDAEITIYEYSDFQCPGCGAMAPVLQALLDDYPNVRLVYRHFPLDFHPYAQITAEAAEAAGEQGKFWEMHDLLFERAQVWGALPQEELQDQLNAYAEELELDVERFAQELEDGTYTEKVQAQYAEATELGLPGTPSFIFNDVLFPSNLGLSYPGLISFMDILENQDEIFFDEPPEMTVTEGEQYQATLKTTQGDIVVQLLPDAALTHVNSFVFLSEQAWYDGAEFFFVQNDFVAVSGDPTNTTIGYPGYYCAGEEQAPAVFNQAGLVGMLSNGQFFITLGATPAQVLNDPFALVGQVIEGLDVLDALTRIPSEGNIEPVPDVVESIEITKK